MSEILNTASCPTCHNILKKMPKARSKCPSCKEWIYLKKPFKSSTAILMNAEQRQAVDNEWAQEHERKKFSGDKESWVEMTSQIAYSALELNDVDTARKQFLELTSKLRGEPRSKIFMKEFYRCELLLFQGTSKSTFNNLNHVQIEKINQNMECIADCGFKNKPILSIKKALKSQKLPCKSELCNCGYTPLWDDELPKRRGLFSFLKRKRGG